MEDLEILNEEEESNIITLTDETGEDVEFEYLDVIEYQGTEYIVLMPVEEDDNSVVILKIEPVDEEVENYLSVDDDTANAVYEIFKEKYKDVLTFED